VLKRAKYYQGEFVMSHVNRRIGIFSALVVATAVSSVSRAEDSGDASEPRSSQDEVRRGQPSRLTSDDSKRRTDAKNASDRGISNERKAIDRRPAPVVPSRMNEAFTFPLSGGCDYTTTVRGTVKPARGPAGEEPKYVPNLVVNAWVSCQNNTEMRVMDNTLRDVPMTRAELEQAIELRASLLTESSATRCAYIPDFALGENKLAGVGIFYLCPAGGAQAQGAPLDDLPDENVRPAIQPERPAEGRTPSSGRPSPENRPASETRGASERRSPSDRDKGSFEEPR
jgi:hypothetical protein